MKYLVRNYYLIFELIFLLKITKHPIRLKDPRILIKILYLVGAIYNSKYYVVKHLSFIFLLELFLAIA